MKLSVRKTGCRFRLTTPGVDAEGTPYVKTVAHGITKEHIAEEMAEAFNTRREVLEAVLVLSDDYVDSNIPLVEQVRIAREKLIRDERTRILNKINSSPLIGLSVPLTEDDLL